MAVRKATLRDLGHILRLEERYFGPPKEDFRALIKLETPNEECAFFLVEEDRNCWIFQNASFQVV